MKKIDRRKAIKKLATGLGGASLMASPLAGLANTGDKSKTIPAKDYGNSDIDKPGNRHYLRRRSQRKCIR